MDAEHQYLEWKRRNSAIACKYARQMALRPARYGQATEIVTATGTSASLAADLEARIARLVTTPGANAAAILYPEITTLEVAAPLFLELANLPGWTVSTSAIANQGFGDFVAVHVSRLIPFQGHDPCPSAALVLGPFDAFPATRRAPVLGFEIYVGEPQPLDPKYHQPTTKAHLAHVDMFLPGASFDRMWDESKARRLVSLGGVDDGRAKANVAFVVPLQLAADLGCAP